jgi:hypothetical protein
MLRQIVQIMVGAAIFQGSCCAWLMAELAGADDDQIVVANAGADTTDRNTFEANFDQWVFPGATNAEAGRRRMEAQARLQIAEVERSCQLSAEQKSRLELAARGDFERFNEQVEALRRKFAGSNVRDRETINRLFQELRPLQKKQVLGLTGNDTLLTKALTRTLQEQQTKQFEASQVSRRRFRYEANIAIALETLERTAPMTSEQREKLRQALVALPPPRTFGQMDQLVLNYRFATLSSSPAVKQILDAHQWQALQPTLDQSRDYKQHLLEWGCLAEDLDVKPAEAKQ